MLSSTTTTTLMIESASFSLSLGLIILTPSLIKRRSFGNMLFFIMCLFSLVLSATGAGLYLIRELVDHNETFSMIVITAHEILMALFLVLWASFVNYQIYGSRDHIFRKKWALLSPIFIIIFLMILNLFTRVVFSFKEDSIYQVKPVYFVNLVIEAMYVIGPSVLLMIARKKKKEPVFFVTFPFVLSYIAGVFATAFSPFAVRGLGISVGLVLLHFSMMNKRVYVDEERNCFNRAFLEFMAVFATKLKLTTGSLIMFEAIGKDMELSKILQEEKPESSALIHIKPGRYVILSREEKKSAARLLVQNVTEICEEENIDVVTDIAIRGKDESAEAFLQHFV